MNLSGGITPRFFNANHADVSWEVAMYSLGVQDGEIQNVVFCA